MEENGNGNGHDPDPFGAPLRPTYQRPKPVSIRKNGKKFFGHSLASFFPEVRGPNRQAGETGPSVRPQGSFDRAAQAAFLERCIIYGPRLAENAYAVGVCPFTERQHRKNDPEYREAFEAMQDIWRGRVEAEVVRRGMVGWDEPVFFAGREVGTIRRFSDPCLLALMKRYDPSYREGAQVELNVGAAGVLVVNAAPATAEEWRERFGRAQQVAPVRDAGGVRQVRSDGGALPPAQPQEPPEEGPVGAA